LERNAIDSALRIWY